MIGSKTNLDPAYLSIRNEISLNLLQTIITLERNAFPVRKIRKLTLTLLCMERVRSNGLKTLHCIHCNVTGNRVDAIVLF